MAVNAQGRDLVQVETEVHGGADAHLELHLGRGQDVPVCGGELDGVFGGRVCRRARKEGRL